MSKFENLGLNQSTLLRILKGDLNWYHDNSQGFASNQLVVKIKTKSSSLIRLSVQGISKRKETRNLLETGGLVHVAESLSPGRSVSLGGQFLLTPEVGSVRIFLSSFSGPSEISDPVHVQICEVRDIMRLSKPPLKNAKVTLSSQVAKLSLSLRNCEPSGVCESKVRDEAFWRRLNLGARSILNSGYGLTEKIYGLNESVDRRLRTIFAYSDSSLQPYSLRCISNCPDSGIISLEWTNSYGFRTSLVLALSEEVDGTYAQIFAPLMSSMTEPKIVLRNYSGTSTRNAIYEFWSEDVKR